MSPFKHLHSEAHMLPVGEHKSLLFKQFLWVVFPEIVPAVTCSERNRLLGTQRGDSCNTSTSYHTLPTKFWWRLTTSTERASQWGS